MAATVEDQIRPVRAMEVMNRHGVAPPPPFHPSGAGAKVSTKYSGGVITHVSRSFTRYPLTEADAFGRTWQIVGEDEGDISSDSDFSRGR
jgi:hypothetical protein